MPDWIARKDTQPEGRPNASATGGFSHVTAECKVHCICDGIEQILLEKLALGPLQDIGGVAHAFPKSGLEIGQK